MCAQRTVINIACPLLVLPSALLVQFQFLTVRDLGVYIDTDLSMRSHVRRTVSRCFTTLRQLRTIRRQVPTAVFQSLVTALVLPHLDYCNSVLYGLPISLIRRIAPISEVHST